MTNDALGSRETVRLIAGREVRVRLRAKAFLWSTAAFVLAVVVGGVVIKLVAASEGTKHVGYTAEAVAAAAAIEASSDSVGLTIDVAEVASEQAGKEALLSGDLDALVTQTSPQLTVVVKDKLDPRMEPLFGWLAQQFALVDAVASLGGDPVEVAQTVGSATPQVAALEPTPEVDGGQIAAGYITGVLLFLALMTAGQLVAQGVVEEKSSRVVELLLATVRPWQLMAGKVLGIGAVGLLQVVLVVGAGAVTAFSLGLLDGSSLDLGSTALWAVAWFIIGFTTYALVLAGLASLVSRQEDVGSVTAPVTTLMVVPYVIGVSLAPWSPDSPLVFWLSMIPFASPMVMPIRIALGSVAAWEIAVSVSVSLALIPALVWLAGRVYSNAVLRTGGRVRLADALRPDPSRRRTRQLW